MNPSFLRHGRSLRALVLISIALFVVKGSARAEGQISYECKLVSFPKDNDEVNRHLSEVTPKQAPNPANSTNPGPPAFPPMVRSGYFSGNRVLTEKQMKEILQNSNITLHTMPAVTGKSGEEVEVKYPKKTASSAGYDGIFTKYQGTRRPAPQSGKDTVEVGYDMKCTGTPSANSTSINLKVDGEMNTEINLPEKTVIQHSSTQEKTAGHPVRVQESKRSQQSATWTGTLNDSETLIFRLISDAQATRPLNNYLLMTVKMIK